MPHTTGGTKLLADADFLHSGYRWPLPPKLCAVWIYLDVLFSTASIMHLCAISLDRYVAIQNPIHHSRFNSRTKAFLKIIAVWTISVGKWEQYFRVSLKMVIRAFQGGLFCFIAWKPDNPESIVSYVVRCYNIIIIRFVFGKKYLLRSLADSIHLYCFAQVGTYALIQQKLD